MFSIWRRCPRDVALVIMRKYMTMDDRLAWGLCPGHLLVPVKLIERLIALCEKQSKAYTLSLHQPVVEIILQGPQSRYTEYVIMLAFQPHCCPVTMWHWGDSKKDNSPRDIVDIHTAEEFRV